MSVGDFVRIRYDILAALFALRADGRDQPNKNDIERRSGRTEADVQTGLAMLAGRRQVRLIEVDQHIVAASLEPGALPSAWNELQTFQVLDAIQTLGSQDHPYVDSWDIARHVSREPKDVEDHLRTLSEQRAVELNLTHNMHNGPMAARLIAIGRQWVREGVPANHSQAIPLLPGHSTTFHAQFHGPVGNVSQGNTGPTTQVYTGQGTGDLAGVLQQIRDVIERLDVDDDERADAISDVEKLQTEAASQQPRHGRVTRLLDGIGRFADLYGASEGGARLLALIAEANRLFASLPPTPPLPPGPLA